MLNITTQAYEFIQEFKETGDENIRQQLESYRVAIENMLNMDLPEAIMNELEKVAEEVDQLLTK